VTAYSLDSAQQTALRALIDAVRRAGVTPCADDDRFIDEDPHVQAQAARGCRHCPALSACAAYGRQYPTEAGVYGGVTEKARETPRPPRKPARARPTLTDAERAQRRRESSRRSRARKKAAQAAQQEGIPA
jgi:hypothetical protein